MPADRNAREQIALLLAQLDEGFNRKSWHGTNLRGSLRGITEGEALWRPRQGRHNIWEETLHAAYWKYAVRRRLSGEQRGTFALKGSNWFPCPGPGVPARWQEAVRILDTEHRRLRLAVASLRDRDLSRKAEGSRTSNRTLITGIIAHDLYHAGQIQLIKRLRRR
jgi:hypothetical protein